MKLQQLRQIIREEVKMTLNEGILVTKAQVKGKDLKDSVTNLETHLMKIGEEYNINWDWEELGSLVADIIHEARMLGGYD